MGNVPRRGIMTCFECMGWGALTIGDDLPTGTNTTFISHSQSLQFLPLPFPLSLALPDPSDLSPLCLGVFILAAQDLELSRP